MADLMEYKCPACGGAMEFDSKTQKMKCPYCDTEMDVETFQKMQDEKAAKKTAGSPEERAAEEIVHSGSAVLCQQNYRPCCSLHGLLRFRTGNDQIRSYRRINARCISYTGIRSTLYRFPDAASYRLRYHGIRRRTYS